jgi:hypothetical protein
MRGPGYRGGDSDDDGDDEEKDDISTRRVGGTGDGANGDDEEASEATLHVDSYAVQTVQRGPTDEEIRQRIFASTPRAQPVCILGSEPKAQWDWSTVLRPVVVVACVLVAVAVGVSVSLAAG